ncbi:MAG TPA: hypothetical protein ENI11_01185, partial [Actinobacteria bacterium]|nr:hypothetical protein [Actinomycetota bacterium]
MGAVRLSDRRGLSKSSQRRGCRMRYERVVLVSPRYDVGPNALADHPPSGLGYLSQALEDAHIDHMVIDQRVGLSDDDMLTRIAQYEPDLIGISMMTYLHQHTYATIRKVRAAWSRADIIVGGPHVSTLREAVLGECLEIDFGAVLEGEGTLTELCLGRSIESIEGLIHRDGDDVIFNVLSVPQPKPLADGFLNRTIYATVRAAP